eukprot:SAG25_NODE_8267_length_430_cov_1.694864_1_plen_63_part_01
MTQPHPADSRAIRTLAVGIHVPLLLATFDLRAETMFWAVENPSPSISKCLDGGFCELYVCEPL